ncbi:MAG: CDGSH iron-sulfur domain-containing protein [Ardenticatenia bacterium]|nr:CDGSH iron-sulfur domain-containing protein [Ardenticatenia bacterium]
MAEVETKGSDHPLTTVKLEPGEKVALCRCFASAKFPFCDGTHTQHPGRGPAVVEAVKKE